MVPVQATPFKRLVMALIAIFGGGFIVNVVPAALLMSLHLTRIAGPGAAAAFSLVAGLGGVCAIIANPLAGRISDRTTARFGRCRTWILIGGVTGTLVLFTMTFTTQVWQVVLVWCVVQTLINFQFAAANAAVADQIPADRRGSVSGLVGMIGAIAPVIGLGLVTLATGRPAVQWGIVAFSGMAGVIIGFLLLRDPRHTRPEDAPPLNLRELARAYWLSPRRHPAFAWAWLVRFLVTCTYASSAYMAFLLLDRFRMNEAQVSKTVLGLTLTAILFISVMAGVGGYLSDRFRRQKPFVMGGSILAAVGLAVIAFAATIPVLYVGMGILGFGFGIFLATDFALCIRMLPNAEDIGKDFAVLGIAGTLPASFVPLLAPVLLWLGGFHAFYLTIAALGLIGGLVVRRIPEIGQEGDSRFAQITVEA